MPISTRKLGPGVLELGATPLAASAQLTGCKITPSEEVETVGEAVTTLTLEKLEPAESIRHTFVIEGNFLQDDPGATSVVDWSWDNAGTEQPFKFTPNTESGGREVSGTLIPVPLGIGGDEVESRMASDFSWRIVGTPTRAVVA